MNKLAYLSAVLVVLGLTLAPAVHAQAAAGTVGQVVVALPMAGHGSAFEEGARRHMEWYGDNGGSWTWAAFEIAMGERTGHYVWFTGGHQYADWDTPDVDPQGSNESIDRNISPHVEDVTVSLVNLRPDLSILRENAPLRPIYEVITLEVHPGKEPQFLSAMAMLKDVFEAAPQPAEYAVYQGAQGSNGEWVVSIPYASFGDLTPPSDEGFAALVRSVHGETGARVFDEQFAESVASFSSEIFTLRPDLSVNLPSM